MLELSAMGAASRKKYNMRFPFRIVPIALFSAFASLRLVERANFPEIARAIRSPTGRGRGATKSAGNARRRGACCTRQAMACDARRVTMTAWETTTEERKFQWAA